MKLQKKLAAKLLKTSPQKIKLDQNRLEEIDEAITKQDVRELIQDNAITKKQSKGNSRSRANHIKQQKSKGRRKGPGSRKGSKNARLSQKQEWMNNIRSQRKLLKTLRDNNKINSSTYRDLYNKSKGGFFRNTRHIKLYLKEHELIHDEN